MLEKDLILKSIDFSYQFQNEKFTQLNFSFIYANPKYKDFFNEEGNIRQPYSLHHIVEAVLGKHEVEESTTIYEVEYDKLGQFSKIHQTFAHSEIDRTNPDKVENINIQYSLELKDHKTVKSWSADIGALLIHRGEEKALKKIYEYIKDYPYFQISQRAQQQMQRLDYLILTEKPTIQGYLSVGK